MSDSILRKNTQAFIDANKISVRLTRYRKTSTAAGGWTIAKVGDLTSQDARLVRSANQGATVTRTLPDGRVVVVEAILVMLPEADIQEGDTFDYEGKTWVVGFVQKTINESINAQVGARG